jgi:hypothetical protein
MMLLIMREEGAPPGRALEIVSADSVEVYLQFSHVLDDPATERVEELGVTFHREGGMVVHVGTVYSAEVPWDALCALAEREDVHSIESAWKPDLVPPGAGDRATILAHSAPRAAGHDQVKVEATRRGGTGMSCSFGQSGSDRRKL